MTTAVSSGENFIAVVRDGSSNDLSGPALSLYWINDTGLRATLGDAVARFNPLSSLRVSLSPASMSATEGGRWRSTLAPATGYFQGRGRMAAALAPATAAFVGKGQLRATLAPITATFIGKGRLIASLSPAVTQAFVLNKYWLGISADTFSASAAPDGMVEVVVRETLALTSSTLGGASFSVNSIDLLRVSDVCRQLIELFVEESVTVSDLAAGDPLKIADLVDSLISTGTSSGQHDALISIAVAMAIIEAAEAGFIADAVASISANSRTYS